MAVKRHSATLWQVTRLFWFNAFLVREDDGLTLVDTGMAGTAPALLRAAADIGQPIARIVLTHAHADHVGSLDALVQQQPAIEIAMSPRTADFIQGRVALLPDEPQAPIKGGFIPCAARPTRLLAPGDAVGSLRVVAAPGHSPDHLAFLDERDGTLFAGDAFQTQGGTAVSGMLRWTFPFPALATWHRPTALATARALRALAPTRLAVGHGRLLTEPLPAMDAAIRAAEARFDGQA